MENKNDNQITFFLHEKNTGTNDTTNTVINEEIQKLWFDFEKEELVEDLVEEYEVYENEELYYNEACTVKDLLKICHYYGIDKSVKASKCKKQDIITTLLYFESQPENYELVQKRNRMWAYITELSNDSKMKQFVIWP
jgi:hypothetical protein